eukprot:3336210-Amphidinium_carterae.2
MSAGTTREEVVRTESLLSTYMWGRRHETTFWHRHGRSATITSTKSSNWATEHEKLKASWGIDDNVPKWSVSKQLRLAPATLRVRDLIDLAYAKFYKSLPSEQQIEDTLPACPFIVDVSQSLQRKPWSDRVRSMCSGSCFYVYSEDRCLVPKEHLMLLGWHSSVRTSSLTDTQIRDLSGESMGSACVCIAALALLSCVPDTSVWESTLA